MNQLRNSDKQNPTLSRWRGWIIALVLAIAGLIALVVYPSASYITGEGTFLQAEHTVRCVNQGNQPIPNIDIVVNDANGRVAYGYPVTNFTGRGSIKTDRDGKAVLYHVATGPEFSWKKGYYLYFLSYESGGVPKFTVNYYIGDKLVYYHQYMELDEHLLQKYRDLDVLEYPRAKRKNDIIDENGLPRTIDEEFFLIEKEIVIETAAQEKSTEPMVLLRRGAGGRYGGRGISGHRIFATANYGQWRSAGPGAILIARSLA